MLPPLEAPELVFGICSAIGTDHNKVIRLISEPLNKYHYETSDFKVTSLMQAIALPNHSLHDSPVEDRYDSYIKYANEIRSLFDDQSVLSVMCCAALRAFRRKTHGNAEKYISKNAYIFHQFKRREEIQLLRQIYGRLFILVSVYSDKEERVRRLSERIARDHAVSRVTIENECAAKELVKRDEDEEGEPSGQRLRDAFPLGDIFINIDDTQQAEFVIDRFLASFFGSNKISPTKDEYGIYMAKSAALRSLDLSRQVGAAIFSKEGEIISLGCNEVPRSGGGTYWSPDIEDARDFVLERDENERIKRALLIDFVRRFVNSEKITVEQSEEYIVNVVLEELSISGSSIRESQIMDLLEYGRNIHAEMSAISDAARLGRNTRGAILYCTTFPCHMCAKHIVAAGLERVVYIEPFAKSYAEELHRDSIHVGAKPVSGKVLFSPFIGVSPFRFRDLFERGKRKNRNGEFIEWVHVEPRPIVPFPIATYLLNERAITKRFDDKASELVEAGKIKIVEDVD